MSGRAEKFCERCGSRYQRPQKISATQWADRKFCSKSCAAARRSVADEQVVEMYERGMSSREIGDAVGVSDVHVRRILESKSVSRRTRSEAISISHSRPETLAKMADSATGRQQTEEAKDKLRARVGSKNANWRNGLTVGRGGYLVFTESPANGEHAGRFLHRVVAEWKLGRPLRVTEVVHHRDRNKLNNDPSNLDVMSASDHARLHIEAGEFRRKKANA